MEESQQSPRSNSSGSGQPQESETERLLLRLYLQEIVQIPLLTAQEEIEAGRQIAEGRQAARRATGADESGRPEMSDRVRLALTARRRLVEGNLRLVVSVARRYRGRGLSLLDLIQEGNIGLLRAVEKFDHTRGFRFSTYATWWIRQAVGRAILEQSRTIRLPVYLLELVGRIGRAREELAARLGRDPSDEEVAAEVGEPLERVSAAGQVIRQVLSLEQPIDEDGVTLGELLPDPSAEDPFEVASQDTDREVLGAALHVLDPRERIVLELRSGMNGTRPHTLAEVAERLGLSRERIRQIEQVALGKLRHPSISRHLRDLLG
jgi:RNA polymerase primary sigma factor